MIKKKIFKTLEEKENSKIGYSKLIYQSHDNVYFDFNGFGSLSRFYLKLVKH